MNPKVDFYFHKTSKWQQEINLMRDIILDCGLNEELKWGVPCYTYEKKNVLLIHVFKDYCAILFFKGSLLKDPKNILIQQTKNVQAARQIRFSSAASIAKMKTVLKAYINEAIELNKAGIKMEFKKTKEFAVPEEFQKKLNESAQLKKAFYNLTPGRQRGYLLYFSSAKQSTTRESRINKYIPQILNGKGIND